MNAILHQSRNSFVQTSGARVPVDLFAQRRSETPHMSGQYLDAGVNLRSMPAFFGVVLRAAACDFAVRPMRQRKRTEQRMNECSLAE